ncbi:MAG: hypothetical protein RX318_06110 [bacterium]|nr:hypothetical protein [bacterium]
MQMSDCGHNIYGEHRPFHIAINPADDKIIVVSNEAQPGPIDMNSVFIDEYYFGGVERFVNKDLFDVQAFYNFCSLCEDIVLKDRVIISYDVFSSDFANQLRNEGVLSKTLWPDEARSTLFDRTSERVKVLGGEGLDFHILAKLGLSKMMGISYTPPVQELNRTEELLNKLNERVFTSVLMDAYSQLSKALEKDINLIEKQGRKIEFFIPPVIAILLNRISEPEEIPEELLSMRREFAKTREVFREYLEKIQDDSVSLEKSLNAIKNLQSQMQEITKPYERKSITAVKHWKELVDIIPFNIEETELKNFSIIDILKKLAGIPIELILKKIKMRDTVHLIRLKKEFFEISDYNNLVKKVFGNKLTIS